MAAADIATIILPLITIAGAIWGMRIKGGGTNAPPARRKAAWMCGYKSLLLYPLLFLK
jgi:hypothetical protein